MIFVIHAQVPHHLNVSNAKSIGLDGTVNARLTVVSSSILSILPILIQGCQRILANPVKTSSTQWIHWTVSPSPNPPRLQITTTITSSSSSVNQWNTLLHLSTRTSWLLYLSVVTRKATISHIKYHIGKQTPTKRTYLSSLMSISSWLVQRNYLYTLITCLSLTPKDIIC